MLSNPAKSAIFRPVFNPFLKRSTPPRSPASLFALGAQGAWYDPSDLSTLFQDNAGTVPVTAVEQPVGLMLDKSGRENNIVSTADARRPVLRAKYNLLERTEEFDNEYWTKTTATVTPNAVLAPNGTMTADQVDLGAASTSSITRSVTGNGYEDTRIIKIWIRASSTLQIRFGEDQSGIQTITVTDVWQQFTFSASRNYAENYLFTIRNSSGGGAKTIYLWGAQALTPSDEIITGGVYQRVGASTDYDTGPAWLPYLDFDGVDDCLTKASGIFNNTNDKITIFVGLWTRAIAPSGLGVVVESSSSTTSNPGTFHIQVPPGSFSATFRFFSRGSSLPDSLTGTLGVTYPERVFTCTGSNANPTLRTIRRNGIKVVESSSNPGSGNFTAQPLFVGARNDSSGRYRGRLYSLVILGREASIDEITATEQWIAGKTGENI